MFPKLLSHLPYTRHFVPLSPDLQQFPSGRLQNCPDWSIYLWFSCQSSSMLSRGKFLEHGRNTSFLCWNSLTTPKPHKVQVGPSNLFKIEVGEQHLATGPFTPPYQPSLPTDPASSCPARARGTVSSHSLCLHALPFPTENTFPQGVACQCPPTLHLFV